MSWLVERTWTSRVAERRLAVLRRMLGCACTLPLP